MTEQPDTTTAPDDEAGDPNALDPGDFVEDGVDADTEAPANDPVDLTNVPEGEVVDIGDEDDDDPTADPDAGDPGTGADEAAAG